MKIKHNINFLGLITVLFLLANCKGQTERQDDQTDLSTEEPTDLNDIETSANNIPIETVAILNGASGSTTSGSATFTKVGEESVRMNLTISNAKPGSHAVHLHENGDCSAADATSAGAHWNPTNAKHGERGSEEFHKGDIINMTVDENGNGSFEMIIEGWTIGDGGDSDIVNKAVIIHDGADDFTSQPSGAAGTRVACGVIEKKDSMNIN